MSYRLYVNRGYGRSLGNLIDWASGRRLPADSWIRVRETSPGVYRVVDDNLTVKNGNWVSDNTALGFSGWDDEVKNLDKSDGDVYTYLGISRHLRWRDVELTTREFRASSLERLRQALNHVRFCAWCPGDT